MTELEYNNEKQRIVNQLGKPEWDFDRSPLNEPARALNVLKGKYVADKRALAKREKAEKAPIGNTMPLEAALSSIPEAKRKEYNKVQLPEIIVMDADLKGLDSISASIVRDYLSNMDLEPKFLANKYGKSYQFVAGLLNSKAVEAIRIKYYGLSLKAETMKASLRAIKAGDSKVLESAIEFFKLMGTDSIAQGSKPIEDKEAEKKLKDLGDNLASL